MAGNDAGQGLLHSSGRSAISLQPQDRPSDSARPISDACLPVDRSNAARFESALEAPWEQEGWTNEMLGDYMRQELINTRQLFKNPLLPKDIIPQSPMHVPSASLTFKDVAFKIPATRDKPEIPILEPVSGYFAPGQLVAIMGPSGCGKSTLLEILAMKKTSPYTGEILVNGHPRDELFRRVASYVGQEDVMPQHWTVFEAVMFNKVLKQIRPHNVSPVSELAQIDLLLEAFGLSTVKDVYIGGAKIRGVSGGQRRRVTLARGVAAGASLLFCDEPTSGLSATDAELCVKALRIICKKFNILNLVVIHQPRVEVANLFDQLIIMTSEPGRVVYNGPMSGAIEYWARCGFAVPNHCNPCDFFLDMITPGAPIAKVDEFVQAFKDQQKGGIDDLVDQRLYCKSLTSSQILDEFYKSQEQATMRPRRVRYSAYAVTFRKQLSVVLQRKILITSRNPSAIVIPIVVPVLQGFFMGVMFEGIGHKEVQMQLSFVFMLLTIICLRGMQLMPGIIEERHIMKYDTSEALYSEIVFILSEFVVNVPLSLLGALLNILIMYLFAQLSFDYFGLIVGWAVLDFCVFDALFGFIAGVSANVQQAQVMAIPFNSIFMLFSGFLITRSSAPPFLQWIFEISPIGYAIQSIVIRMLQDSPPAVREQILAIYGYNDGEDMKGIIILIAMTVLFKSGQVWSLKTMNHIQK